MTHSWYENTARGRIEAFLDPGSFEEESMQNRGVLIRSG